MLATLEESDNKDVSNIYVAILRVILLPVYVRI